MFYLFMLGIIIVTIVFVVIYNSLIAKKNEIENALGMVDSVLKKRYDLIPNLIAAVQKYMDHEKEILVNITKLRTAALRADDIQDKLNINEKISDNIRSVLVSAEEYPELQSSENMLQLQQTLAEIEGQIDAARRTYNQRVTTFNNACEQIPSNLVAQILQYRKQQILKTSEGEKVNVDVRGAFGDR